MLMLVPGVKNLVAAGLETGMDLVSPSPATSEWKTVVRRNTKNVKVQNADKDRIVTWADIARPKGGLSDHAKANGNKPKFKGKLALGRARPDLVKVVRTAMVDCRKTGVSRFANPGLDEVVDSLSSQRS